LPGFGPGQPFRYLTSVLDAATQASGFHPEPQARVVAHLLPDRAPSRLWDTWWQGYRRMVELRMSLEPVTNLLKQ